MSTRTRTEDFRGTLTDARGLEVASGAGTIWFTEEVTEYREGMDDAPRLISGLTNWRGSMRCEPERLPTSGEGYQLRVDDGRIGNVLVNGVDSLRGDVNFSGEGDLK